MMESVKIATANIVFWAGYYWYKAFGKTPWYSYQSLRKLFYTSNTQFNKRVSEKIAKRNTPYAIKAEGVLGKLAEAEVKNISTQIQKNGFYIFPNLLDEANIAALTELSLQTKAKLVPKPATGEDSALFERGKEKAIKYQFMEGDLVQNATVQKLFSDRSILAVAQAFLGSKPVLDLVSMWWSTAVSKKASSEVAQLYHWDMERIKFIKFFFYLTDVDTNTGPHCYVRGSNNGFPSSVRRDGRITDEEIAKAFPKEDILEICGKRGTILAVDTSGFHKGKNLVHSDRLLLQFEYANSLFGINTEDFAIDNASSELKVAAEQFPFIFQRYKI